MEVLANAWTTSALRSLYDSTLLWDGRCWRGGVSPQRRAARSPVYTSSFFLRRFPRVPDLVCQAEARVEELGGMYRKPGVSRPLYPVREVLGWKTALRLQRFYARSGVEGLVQKMKSLFP